MSLWPLWLYLGTLALVFAGAWWWQRPHEPPSVTAERQDLVEQYADPDLRWPKPRPHRSWRPR